MDVGKASSEHRRAVARGNMGYSENTVLHILMNKVIGDGNVFHYGVKYMIG